jgi:hypothetical protein
MRKHERTLVCTDSMPHAPSTHPCALSCHSWSCSCWYRQPLHHPPDPQANLPSSGLAEPAGRKEEHIGDKHLGGWQTSRSNSQQCLVFKDPPMPGSKCAAPCNYVDCGVSALPARLKLCEYVYYILNSKVTQFRPCTTCGNFS